MRRVGIRRVGGKAFQRLLVVAWSTIRAIASLAAF
jgi:hypothetical protein